MAETMHLKVPTWAPRRSKSESHVRQMTVTLIFKPRVIKRALAKTKVMRVSIPKSLRTKPTSLVSRYLFSKQISTLQPYWQKLQRRKPRSIQLLLPK